MPGFSYPAEGETRDASLLGKAAAKWQGIPVKRGKDSSEAFRKAAGFLEQGEIILISPEGNSVQPPAN